MPQGGRLFHFTGVIRLCDAKRRADEPEQKLLLFHFRRRRKQEKTFIFCPEPERSSVLG
jgi:hypothetical protein